MGHPSRSGQKFRAVHTCVWDPCSHRYAFQGALSLRLCNGHSPSCMYLAGMIQVLQVAGTLALCPCQPCACSCTASRLPSLCNSASGSSVACAGGENEFIWQAWAVLEGKMGNAGHARKVCHILWQHARSYVSSIQVAACEAISTPQQACAVLPACLWLPNSGLTASAPLQLFDAATVANSKHAAAWHGWGLLEKREGNMVKARDLWMKVGATVARSTASLLHALCTRQLASPTACTLLLFSLSQSASCPALQCAWCPTMGLMLRCGHQRRLVNALAEGAPACMAHAAPCLPRLHRPALSPSCGVQGIKMCASEQERLHTPYLHHSLALLAAELGQVKEARQWFQSGTMTLQVRLVLPAQHRPVVN